MASKLTHLKNNKTQTIQPSLKLEFIIVKAWNSREDLLDSVINIFLSMES